MIDADQLAKALVRAIERDADLRERLRAIFAPAAPANDGEPQTEVLYERVSDFARRIAISRRKIWSMVAAGEIATIGKGRARRVDVVQSLAMLRGHRGRTP